MIAVGSDGTWYVMSRTPETRIGDRHALYDACLNELIRLEQLGSDVSERSDLVMEHIAAHYGLRYDRVTGPKDEQATS